MNMEQPEGHDEKLWLSPIRKTYKEIPSGDWKKKKKKIILEGTATQG